MTDAHPHSGDQPAPRGASRTVVLIHGMFVTPECWRDWTPHLKARGYTVHAPAWPHHDQPPAALRAAHPDKALGRLTLEEVVQTYAAAIEALAEKPILIGHSMGGLVVQLLLQRQLGVAGVAIDSAPPKGVVSLRFSFLKSNWPVVSPFADRHAPYLMDQAAFNYAFAHTLPEATQREAYTRLVVPESRLVGRAPTTDAARIDFTAPRPPLLLIAGADDHIIPASLNHTNARKYKPSVGRTDFKVFPDRTHYIIGQDNWQAVADYALDWLEGSAG